MKIKATDIVFALVILSLTPVGFTVGWKNHERQCELIHTDGQTSTDCLTDEEQRLTDEPVFVEMTITHYDAGACCCGRFADGITASGVPAVGLIVAADTDYYPFGTKMVIDGVTYTVQDRGGAIKGPNRIDILCKTHAEAKLLGVINRNVIVFER